MEILVPISGIAMIVAVVWIAASSRLRAARIHADTVGKLIDKLGTSQEAMAYLESESGRSLLDALTARPGSTLGRIIAAAATGVVLSALGMGLLVLGATGMGDDGSIAGGIIVLALGIGFLLSAMLSYRLSRSWGLVNGQSTKSRASQIAAVPPA